jgi:hypothetical protein
MNDNVLRKHPRKFVALTELMPREVDEVHPAFEEVFHEYYLLGKTCAGTLVEVLRREKHDKPAAQGEADHAESCSSLVGCVANVPSPGGGMLNLNL